MVQNLLKDKIVSMIVFSFVLIALVASDVLVLDEEALVAGCFVLFVLFAYKNVGDVIASELEDRSTRIQKELQKSFDQQKELLALQIENTQKQLSIVEEVKELAAFSQFQMNLISEKRRKAIVNRLAAQTNLQLKHISLKEKEIVESLQKEAIHFFTQAVLQEFKSNTPEAVEARGRLLQEGIEQLKQ